MWLCSLLYVAMQPAVWSYAACCVAGPGFWQGHIILFLRAHSRGRDIIQKSRHFVTLGAIYGEK